MKIARGAPKEPYECKYDWAEDCFVQCGGDGIVFTDQTINDAFENPVETMGVILGMEEKPKHYKTAFFEAFPRSPNTFIRGEGVTIEDAEKQAWKKFQKYSKCPKHEYEKRGYTNGAGFCKHCNMFGSKVFEPEKSWYKTDEQKARLDDMFKNGNSEQ